MAAFATLEEARYHLRVEPDYPAEQVAIYLEAAQDVAEDFLNRKVYATQQEMENAMLDGAAGDHPMVMKASVKVAILLIMGHLHANRENTSPQKIEAISMDAHDLLWPSRRGLGV